MGIDYGSKRIGMSLGSPELKIASPIGCAGKLEDVVALAMQEQVGLFVIGMPYKLSGASGKMTEKVEIFKRKLEKATGIKAVLMDERYSSRASDSLAGTAKEKAGRDSISAMLILQAYFDGHC